MSKIEPSITLLRFGSLRCVHSKFIVDPKLDTVECGICGEKLNPIWVLEQFCHEESRVRRTIEHLEQEAKFIENRVRTRCDHCKKMTRIKKR